MTLMTFAVDPELLVLNLYVKNPTAYPGQSPEEWVYKAQIGDTEAKLCNFQGFPERLYCNFIIPESFLNTSQTLKLFVNDCLPPFYINQNVSIFRKDPSSEKCSINLSEAECIAAGGTYISTNNSCDCP